jgi:DNA gyrase/topoisomerase IV subunit B
LRGKPKNTASIEIEEVLDNKEMKDLISAIGVGVNDYHDLSEVRYGKVIIVADADSDGKNINALVLGALATHLTFLVEAGYVFVAEPPLFEQDGKYYFSKDELKEGKPFGRFKGLGECNPEDLAPFVFDKSHRKLIQITMDNWELAQEMLTSSMAKREVLLNNQVIQDSLVLLEE